MNTSRKLLPLLVLGSLCLSVAQAADEAAPAQGGDSVIDKTGRAIKKGAQATADGAEYVTEKVVNGVKRGAKATGDAIERGGKATGRALGKAADKVGISDKGKQAEAPAPVGDGAGAADKP